jgi:hypothetical protein
MSAVLSPCRRYRYVLTREIRSRNGLFTTASYVPRVLLVIMLNPSKADEKRDDPTIRKLIGFCLRWGYDRLVVVNLYAWRATDPRELQYCEDPIGPDNDAHIGANAAAADLVLCAWGASKFATDRAEQVLAAIRRLARPHYLRMTKDGRPEHPLYVPYGLTPQPWELGL